MAIALIVGVPLVLCSMSADVIGVDVDVPVGVVDVVVVRCNFSSITNLYLKFFSLNWRKKDWMKMTLCSK